MKKNTSNTDRVVRLVIAGILFIFWFEDIGVKGWGGTILLIVAGILLATSFVGWCPLYGLFGIHTNAKKKQQSS